MRVAPEVIRDDAGAFFVVDGRGVWPYDEWKADSEAYIAKLDRQIARLKVWSKWLRRFAIAAWTFDAAWLAWVVIR